MASGRPCKEGRGEAGRGGNIADLLTLGVRLAGRVVAAQVEIERNI